MPKEIAFYSTFWMKIHKKSTVNLLWAGKNAHVGSAHQEQL